MRSYDSLLEHPCPTCAGHVIFPTFKELKEHMRKIHEKFYCDLCLENVKVIGFFYIYLPRIIHRYADICCYSKILIVNEQNLIFSYVKIQIFTRERRCYTRAQLGLHRRKGDTDDTSHRGHPLCQFCDTRYMDKDDLYRHLRRDHFYCHFCDGDGCYYECVDFLFNFI